MIKPFVAVLLSLVFISLSPSVNADDRIYGTWIESKSKQRIDILDGFESGKGAVLVINPEGEVEVGKWEEDTSVKLTLGWSSEEVKFVDDESFTLGSKTYVKRASNDEDVATISLKDDPKSFIQKLTEFEWITSLESQTANFKITFSEDTGVIEFSKADKLAGLSSWAVSSGVLKIGSNIIVEARVSDRYFIGLNESDKFVIFNSLKPSDPMVTTDVKKDREKFFDAFLTDEWLSTSWGGSISTHRFRPVYGDLKGIKLTLKDGKHSEDETWEYSPSTGALKFGYTKYIGAIVVNDTLAFLTKDGKQTFYNRAPGGAGKRFTLSDVTKVPLNENSLNKINKTLSGQFQNSNFLYQFEFNQDLRTGFLHKWRSEPLSITGETFTTSFFSKSETLYVIEDFVIFGDNEVYKRDISASRLKPKTEEEVLAGKEKQEKILDNALNKSILVRVTKIDGTTIDVTLPISDFSQISSLQVIKE